MKYLFLCMMAAGFAACNQPEQPNKIEVIGVATMKIVPDMLELSLRAGNVKPAMKDAVAETQAAVNQILAVCRKYVSDPSDIKVSTISTNKSYEYQNNGREVFNVYAAAQVLDVTLRDISKVEQFTEELLATRISRIDNMRYNHTKADSILREVNLLALEDARKTAEKMCAKMNVSLGKITFLSNWRESGATNIARNEYDMELYNKSFGGRGFKMTTEILQFQDKAFAAFEIK